jgi:hypothetical protein
LHLSQERGLLEGTAVINVLNIFRVFFWGNFSNFFDEKVVLAVEANIFFSLSSLLKGHSACSVKAKGIITGEIRGKKLLWGK